jgi:hypothetical protein
MAVVQQRWGENDSTHRAGTQPQQWTFCNQHRRKKTPQGGKAFKTRNDTANIFPSLVTVPNWRDPLLELYSHSARPPSWGQKDIRVYLQGFLHILVRFHHFKCNNWML